MNWALPDDNFGWKYRRSLQPVNQIKRMDTRERESIGHLLYFITAQHQQTWRNPVEMRIRALKLCQVC